MNAARRLPSTALASLCALAGVLALGSAAAQAEVIHKYLSQMTGFGDPVALTIDSSSDVYVVDGANETVAKFDSSGAPLAFSASESYVQGGKLTGTPSGPFGKRTVTGAFGELHSVAVDNATGDVYVADGSQTAGDPSEEPALGVVDIFSSTGEYLSQVTGPPPSAPVSGPFTDPQALAVDQATHDLYVVDGRGVADVFSATGEYRSQFGHGVFNNFLAESIAVNDLTEAVYVGDSSRSIVDVFGAAGTFLSPPLNGASTPMGSFGTQRVYVGLNKASGQVYVAETDHKVVDEFGSSSSEGYEGQLTGTPAGPFLRPHAVAVDPSNGHVYVADDAGTGGISGVVDVFGPDIIAPGTSAQAASSVTKTTATLNGAVNPAGVQVTSCEFEYGTSASYGQSVPCGQSTAEIGAGGSPVAVTAKPVALAAGTTYHFRLNAANANGSNPSRDETFTTPPAVDGLSTGPVEAVTPSTAKLTGSLSPDGADTHYYFEYGTKTSYGSVSPALPGTDAGNASESVSASTSLAGLAANTTYHYRLVGVNSFGTTYGEDAMFPTSGSPAVLAESFSSIGSTRVTFEAQVNPDGFDTHYRFEYGPTASYGTSIPIPDGDIPAGFEAQTVSAVVTGLQTRSTYHYRVVATSEAGTVNGADQTVTTLPPALVDSESASSVAASSATLNAQINPLGTDTTAYLQYGSVSCSASPASCTDLPLPPGIDLGSGEGDVSVSVHVQGLAPGATYYYRVLAANALGAVEGADRAFTTQAAGTEVTQPDGRLWEMVSPPNKHGAQIVAVGNEQGAVIQASVNGDGIAYTATASLEANPAGNRAIEVAPILSTRHAPGSWETADITTPHNEGATHGYIVGKATEYELFSSDLSLGLTTPNGDTPLLPGAEETIYLRGARGEYQALVTSANVPSGAKFGGRVGYVYASPDLSHVVLYSRLKLTSAPLPLRGGSMLYEWAGGQLQLASVLPNGESAAASLGAEGNVVRHAISNDGSRLVWKVDPGLGNGQRGHLYMRDMVRGVSGETVAVNAAQGAPEPKSQGLSIYSTASRDDSRVFFTSPERLTANATTLGDVNGRTEDLYVFEVTSGGSEPLAGGLTDLTVDGNAGESADIQGVIGASEDGSYVYFVARGVLGDGAERGAEKGGNNLYMEHYDTGAKAWAPPKFIAALSNGDGPSWKDKAGRAFAPQLLHMTSRVSPNGRYLAFMSERSLTGYENRDANSGVPDEEVFHYDANTGRLVCASCDPTGARPVGLFEGGFYEENLIDYPKIWGDRWLAGNIPGWTTEDLVNAKYQSRYLSDSGRLFFNSPDALVPADVNGKEDVYEYEPAGVGGCQGSTHGRSASVVFSETLGGCVGLISAGTSTEESAFMDASETGGDVFFLTLSKLSPQDYDSSVDLYDAHECTASVPCAPAAPSMPPACTTGDACKPGPTPQPSLFGEPSSETFSGAGNIVPEGTVTLRSSGQAQKLAKALKACRGKPKRKRAGCERQARRKYGAKQSRAGRGLSAGTRR